MLMTLPEIPAASAGMLYAFHGHVRLQTEAPLQFIDITEQIRGFLAASGIRHGVINVQARHTTAAIVVNEDEPLLLEDMKQTLERLAPRAIEYRHDDFSVRTANLTPDEKPNGHAHCKSMFLRTSETLNVVNAALQLGRWQRVFFVELDCARERTISMVALGAGTGEAAASAAST
jgi:secondary thiamine-phosphate synthase enzyme